MRLALMTPWYHATEYLVEKVIPAWLGGQEKVNRGSFTFRDKSDVALMAIAVALMFSSGIPALLGLILATAWGLDKLTR